MSSKSKLELLHSPFEPKTAELAEAVPPCVSRLMVAECCADTIDTAVVPADGRQPGPCQGRLLNMRNLKRNHPLLSENEERSIPSNRLSKGSWTRPSTK